MKVTTESGAEYEFDGKYVTRVNDSAPMRGDSRPLKGRVYGEPRVGYRMTLFLEPLSPQADVTIRTTTPVVSVVGGDD